MTKLTHITVSCDKDHVTTIKSDDFYIYAWDEQCEMCGNHGEVRLDFTCMACNKEYSVVIKEW